MARGEFNWDSIPPVLKTGTNPAAEVSPDNVLYALVVPAGKRWRVQCAYIELVASADAANRTLFMKISDGTNDLYATGNGLTITASQTKIQSWVRNSFVTTAGTQYGMHLPDIELLAGWKIQVGANNFDAVAAGDNATSLYALVQEVPV